MEDLVARLTKLAQESNKIQVLQINMELTNGFRSEITLKKPIVSCGEDKD